MKPRGITFKKERRTKKLLYCGLLTVSSVYDS